MDYDYLFGLIDTDGSLYKEKANGFYRLKITLTNEFTILKCKKFLEINGYTPRYFKEIKNNPNHKDTHSIRLNKQKEIKSLLKKRPKDISLPYIAGVIDGDGSFYYAKQDMKRRFTLHCKKNRKIKIFKKIKIFLEKNYDLKLVESENVDYRISICRPNKVDILVKLINPFLINKKQNDK